MLLRAILLLSATASFAEDLTPSTERPTQALYFHPAITLITSQVEKYPTTVALTYEREISDANSFVLQPTLQFGSVYNPDDPSFVPKTDVFGFQAMIAVHNFFNGSVCEGIYWAPEAKFAYASASRPAFNSGSFLYTDRKASATALSVFAMIGYRAVWGGVTLYSDIGLGRAFVSISGDQDTEGVTASGLALDANLGIGFPF